MDYLPDPLNPQPRPFETAGKIVLREYVNGTIGFLKLGDALGRSPKSLMRMLSPMGNPQARNLFEMVAYLQKAEGTVLKIHSTVAEAGLTGSFSRIPPP
jgi:hypothetical protein